MTAKTLKRRTALTRQRPETQIRLEPSLTKFEAVYELLARLAVRGSLSAALDEVLLASMDVVGADGGYIRLFDPASGNPVTDQYSFAAHKGMSDEYLAHFSALERPVDPRAREAVFSGARVIIEDMTTHPAFQPHLEVVLAEGYRSMQATSLMSQRGSCIGTICTCFRAVYTPPPEAFETLDLYAELASAAIEQHQQIDELARRDAVLTSVAEHQDEALLRIQELIRTIENGAQSLDPEDVRLLARGISDEIRRASASLSTSEIAMHTQHDIGADMEADPYGLSSREMEVMVHVWRGLSDKQIALRMGISRFTVAKHLGSGMRKMNVETRTQASVLIEREAVYRAFPSL